jgi:hypothetical protein
MGALAGDFGRDGVKEITSNCHRLRRALLKKVELSELYQTI